MNDERGTAKKPYKRPPITEAVVEFRLAAPISIEQVEKVKSQLTSEYPLPPQAVQKLAIHPGSLQQPSIELDGYRMVSSDAANIAVIGRSAFSISRLAPYTGWEDFISKARLNWAAWRKVVGWHEVARIGVRYINRIDVPNPDEKPILIDEYLLFRPIFPDFEGGQGIDTFAINGSMGIANSAFRLILNAGLTVSPLVKTTSFLLDIDVSQETRLPRNDDALWSLVEQIRDLKNRIFEASITDRSRRLFSA
jgi:uncharacterized protein (TIGR04255 family)